jgi:hypothetical protein
MNIAAEVLISEQVPAEEAARIAAEFASIGLVADLRFNVSKRSIAEAAWFVLAAVPLRPFFDRLTENAADDAYRRLKAMAERILHRRPDTANKPKSVLVLQDTLTGVQVVLEPDLPAASYRELLNFDLSTIRHGPLHYDMRRRRWRSELDEDGGGLDQQDELTDR